MASMQVSGAAAAGRAWGPPRRGERRRGGGVRGRGGVAAGGLPRPRGVGGPRSGERSRGGVAAGGRGRWRPRSCGIKGGRGEERAKFGVRSAAGAPLRAPARGRPRLGSPATGEMLASSPSPCGPRQGGNSCARRRRPRSRRPDRGRAWGRAGERLAEDGRLPTALRGLCPASHAQPRIARPRLALLRSSSRAPWVPPPVSPHSGAFPGSPRLLRSRPSPVSPASCATQGASLWARSSASGETRSLNICIYIFP